MTEVTDANVEPTAAEVADAKEWEDVAQELFPGLPGAETTTTTTVEPAPETTTTTTVAPDETTTTTTTVAPDTTTTTTTIDPNESAEDKAAREAAEATTTTTTVEPTSADVAARDSRRAAREARAQVDAIAKDVREKMFKDAPTVLQDADGDPITSIQDVMQLINPATIGSADHPQGRGFTEEEAGMWFLSAQQKFNQGVADMEKRITQIAEVQADFIDQANTVAYEFGALLKGNEKLRNDLWAEYSKTLVKDPVSGQTIGVPVSMESFYRTALKPYADAEAKADDQTAEQARVAKEAADAAEAKKKKEREDRSDIFGRGNVDDISDPEEKEWAKAAEVVFGPKKK